MKDEKSAWKRAYGLIVITFLLSSVFSPFMPLSMDIVGVSGEPLDWWDSGWGFRKSLTIDYTLVSGSQVDFPVLVDLDDADLASKAQADGDDIAFVTSDGVKFSHELEYYSAGSLVAWVKVPAVSSTEDTVFYMYYGNPSASSQEDVPGVWDADYQMVLHLDEEVSGDEESHECRMWGMVSATLPESVVLDHLLDLPDSLKSLGDNRNPNGWGLAFYDNVFGDYDISRGLPQAILDPNFDIAAAALAASGESVGLGHVRRASSGATAIPNPHPFLRTRGGKDWALSHNGDLSKSVLKTLIGPAYLSEFTPSIGENWDDPNVVDSDLYMIWVLKNIEEADWDVIAGIAVAITELTAVSPGAANFILSDGERVWGFKKGNTLYYLYNDVASPAYSVVASQPPEGVIGDWVSMVDYNLVELSVGAAPVFYADIRDYSPVPMAYDSTSNDNDGSLVDGVTQGVSGKIDGAVDVDGSTGYIEVPHNTGLSGFTTGFTASGWVRFDSLTGSSTLMNKYETAGSQRAWYIEYRDWHTGIALVASPDGGTPLSQWWMTSSFSTGTWYHVAVVWESGVVPSFYVNGGQITTI